MRSVHAARARVEDAVIGWEISSPTTRAGPAVRRRRPMPRKSLSYQHGGASYLQVLTSENNAFSAELNLARAQLNERLSLVALHNALSGGWQ